MHRPYEMPVAGGKLAESLARVDCSLRSSSAGLFRYCPAPRMQPPIHRTDFVTRLVLGIWAAAIYAIYWLGYLRGSS